MADLRTEKQITAELESQKRLQNDGRQTDKSREERVKRILALEKELTDTKEKQIDQISAHIKLNKAVNKLKVEAQKAEEATNKSLVVRLQHLMKGNVVQAWGNKAEREHSKSQKDLTVEVKKQAKEYQARASAGELTNTQALGLTNLTEDISKGLIEEQNIQERINSLGLEGNDIGDKVLKRGTKLAEQSAGTALKGKEAAAATAKWAKRLGVAGAAFAVLYKIAQQFAGSVDAIGKQFGSLNVLSQDFQKNLFDSSEQASKVGASMEDVASTAATVSSEFGVGLTASGKMAGQLIDTAKAVGLSNDEAAKLSGILQTTSGLSAQQAERLTEGAFQLAAANDVNPSAVLKDMAASSEAFASFSENGGDNIARAAVQARALGLSLDTTAKIAEGLLDFETSIGKELESSVLIGRQLNFQKARELALNNDIEGAISNIVSQLGSEAEFNELNSIQRKAIADSIGVSVGDMAKMVANQDKANKLAGETAKSFADIIGKDAMSELTAAANELKTLGVALANTLGPILMLLAKAVNLLLVPLGNMVSGLSSSIRGEFANATTTINDGIFKPGGITHMMGPSGVFSLNPRDSVMATTNRINDGQGGVGGFSTFPQGTLGGGGALTSEVTLKNNDLLFVTNYMGSNFANGATLGTGENSVS